MGKAVSSQRRKQQAFSCRGICFENRKIIPVAADFFSGIDGDLRVKDDTIIVTFYNAPETNILKEHYVNLPKKLEADGVDPRVPWLYNFKVDFRFR